MTGSTHLLQGAPGLHLSTRWHEPCRNALPWMPAARPSWGESHARDMRDAEHGHGRSAQAKAPQVQPTHQSQAMTMAPARHFSSRKWYRWPMMRNPSMLTITCYGEQRLVSGTLQGHMEPSDAVCSIPPYSAPKSGLSLAELTHLCRLSHLQ